MVVVCLLAYLSYVDLKKREVPNSGILALFFYSIIISGPKGLAANLPIALAVFVGLFIMAVITNEGFGGGDIKLISVLALFMGKDLFLLSLPMAILILITLIWAVVKKKGWRYEIPFVPYVFLSYLVYLGVYMWNTVCLV